MQLIDAAKIDFAHYIRVNKNIEKYTVLPDFVNKFPTVLKIFANALDSYRLYIVINQNYGMRMQLSNATLLGAHFSIARGLDGALRDAASIGAGAAQIFLHSNRQWRMKKELDPDVVNRFKQSMIDLPVKICVVHASYLINLASQNKELRSKSIDVLATELRQCVELGIPYLIMHPGSAGGKDDIPRALDAIADGINEVLRHAPGSASILLENTAGQGNTLGCDLQQLRHIIEHVKDKKRIGVCIDTCHAFAAGYDLRTPSTYAAFWDYFDNVIGASALKALHLNDSKKELGSHVDRHANIGEGQIGLEGFGLLMNDPRLYTIPKILETPYDSYPHGLADYRKNMDVLISLINKP